MARVYIAFSKRKRRFWFGHTWEVCHASSSEKLMEDWLRSAMAEVGQRLGPRPYGHELHDHYRWCSVSLDSPYGKGSIWYPANAADIFSTNNRDYGMNI